MKKYLTVFIFVFILYVSAFAHPGRTDQYGGHYNRSTGEYHYHTGEYAGQKQYNSSINTKNNSVEADETGTKDYRELAGLPKESLIDKIARKLGLLEDDQKVDRTAEKEKSAISELLKDLPPYVTMKPEYISPPEIRYYGTTYKQKTDAYGKIIGEYLTGVNPYPNFSDIEYLQATSLAEAPRAVQEYKKASVDDKKTVKTIAQAIAKDEAENDLKERLAKQHAEIRANIGKSANETYNANETNMKRSNDVLVIFLSLVIVVSVAVLIKNIVMLKSESNKSAEEKNKSSRSAPSFNKKAFLLKLKKFAVVGAIIIVLIIVFIFLNYIIYLSFKFWFGDKGPMKFALAVTDSFLLLLVGLIWGLISKVAGKIIDTYRLKNRFKDLGNEILNHNGEYSLLNITAYVAGNDVPNLRNKYLQSDKPAPELLGELQLAYFKQLDLKDVEAVYRTAGELRLSYYAADLIAETYDGEIDPCIAQITWANAFYKYDDLQESAPEE